jgi:hypothetical protein
MEAGTAREARQANGWTREQGRWRMKQGKAKQHRQGQGKRQGTQGRREFGIGKQNQNKESPSKVGTNSGKGEKQRDA